MNNKKNELQWFEKLPMQKMKRGHRPVNENMYKNRKGIDVENKQQLRVEKYVRDAEDWVSEVAANLPNSDRVDWAWSALRGVLHTLRDRVPPAEVMQLSAQMPMLIRGLYMEGYHLSNKPEKFHADELITRIEDAIGPAPIDGEDAFKAVLRVLYDHIAEGEMSDIYATMPKDICRIWDKNIKAEKA